MSQLATIPGAPITRYRLRAPIDGVPPRWVDDALEPGSWISLSGAKAIYMEPATNGSALVVVELPHDVIWKFHVPTEADARRHVDTFAVRAGR